MPNDACGMITAGMFIGSPPSFDTIIDRLFALERVINKEGSRP